MSQYLISAPAVRDLDAISDYFAQVNIEAGEKFLRAFDRRCQQLVSSPYSGRNYDELEVGLRGLPLDGYIILYRTIDNGGIEIARVINGRQDLDKLFDREW